MIRDVQVLVMLPAAYFPLQGVLFIPLNSIAWGFATALLLKGLNYILNK